MTITLLEVRELENTEGKDNNALLAYLFTKDQRLCFMLGDFNCSDIIRYALWVVGSS